MNLDNLNLDTQKIAFKLFNIIKSELKFATLKFNYYPLYANSNEFNALQAVIKIDAYDYNFETNKYIKALQILLKETNKDLNNISVKSYLKYNNHIVISMNNETERRLKKLSLTKSEEASKVDYKQANELTLDLGTEIYKDLQKSLKSPQMNFTTFESTCNEGKKMIFNLVEIETSIFTNQSDIDFKKERQIFKNVLSKYLASNDTIIRNKFEYDIKYRIEDEELKIELFLV